LEQLNQCFNFRKFQANREANNYLWNKFKEHIPTRSGQQIKDKVRNLNFSWIHQQAQARQKAINNGEEFEEVVFHDLDSYMEELSEESKEEEEEEKTYTKVFSLVDRKKAARLEQEAHKGDCVPCYVWIEKC
jgi:hypothetical protein